MASSGTTQLSVTAVDSYGHVGLLTYLWTASCAPWGPSGTFLPNNMAANPTWTAPANVSGVEQQCTIQVAVSHGTVTASDSYQQGVATVVHTITFSQLPIGLPDPVVSSGVAQLTAAAVDSFGHTPLTYSWQATCDPLLGGIGVFAANPTMQTPSWTAPANLTGVTRSCTIEVTATHAGGPSASASYSHEVLTVPHEITITTPAAANPSPVNPGAQSQLSVAAVDSLGHLPLIYTWTVTCPTLAGNGFLASNGTSTVNWFAPSNATGTVRTCTAQVVIDDGRGLTNSTNVQIGVNSSDHTLEITQGPAGIPNAVGTGGTVQLSVTAVDSAGHGLTYQWSASCPGLPNNGTFPQSTLQNASWQAPQNLTGVTQSCTITVTVTDDQIPALTVTRGYTQQVGTVPHTLTVTTLPNGSPNPVGPGATAAMAIGVVDSLNHDLFYQWSSVCPAANGTFSDPSAAAPVWTAPMNQTDNPLNCTISVTVDDHQGESVTRSFTQVVNSVPHTLTLTVPPNGTPNPVASRGTVTMGATVVDSRNHGIVYAWSASCPALTNTGTFTTGANAQNPTWRAPFNATGLPQVCTIQVIATDTIGESTTASYQQTVSPGTHNLTIVTPPAGNPNPSTAGAPVALSVTIEDSFEHQLLYQWQASCASAANNGTFQPNQTAANPTWTPPPNPGGTDLQCLIRVTAVDTLGVSVTASFVQVVRASTTPAHTVTITTPPSGNPNPVDSGGSVTVTVAATDSLGHGLTYQWTANCPALPGPTSFLAIPPGSATATWTAPQNLTGATQTCTIFATASDGEGQSASANYTQSVRSVPHTLTMTAQPSATTAPSGPGVPVPLTVTAVDSLNHPLTYAWSASCPGQVGNNGTFSSTSVRTPTWTPAAHPQGTAYVCQIQVTISDNQGESVTGSFSRSVTGTPPPHTLTITVPPSGTPNPVSSGAPVALSVTAVDSAGHTLTYAWAATCAGLPTNGTFQPNASAPAPTWNAPTGVTSPQSCTIQVTVTDTEAVSATASYVQLVGPVVHTLTITVPPAGAPNPSAPSAPVVLTVTAVDTFSHQLTHLWQASCDVAGSGTFAPNANAASPTWTPPTKPGGGDVNCLVRVTVFDTAGLSTNATYQHKVSATAPPPHTITFTTPPTGGPNPVVSGGVATLNVAAVDSEGHTPLTYQWSATCPGLPGMGTFTPNPSQTPQWTAPLNATGSTRTCTIQVVASDAFGTSATATYSHDVSSPAHTLTITTQPSGTPNPVGSGGTATLSVQATDSVGHTPVYQWNASCAAALGGNGAFNPVDGISRTPQWTAPVNTTGVEQSCTMQVNVTDNAGLTTSATYQQRVSGTAPVHTLTITVPPAGTPNPVPSSGSAQLSVTAVDTNPTHTLDYTWQATCVGLGGNGSFSPSFKSPAPIWVAPANTTGFTRNCTILLTVTDNVDKTVTASYTQQVSSVPLSHTLTITQSPAGTPNPSTTGVPVQLSVTAVDSLGHDLAYIWQATCNVTGTGTFQPSSQVKAPTWTPPALPPSGTLSCLLRVTVIDNIDKSATATYVQTVTGGPPPHTLTITSSPNGIPNPVTSSSQATLNVVAVDSDPSHVLVHTWTSACPTLGGNGTFAGNGTATPTWTAPPNLTGAEQNCTMQVTVTDGHGESVSASYLQRVSSVPHTFSITTAPTGTPNPVTPTGTVQLSVMATDSLPAHVPSYLWQATCGGLPGNGSFSPTAASRTPIWTPPVHPTGADFACTMQVTADDGQGRVVQASFTQSVSSGTAPPHTLTITVPPGGTPNPVASGTSAALSVTAVDSQGHGLLYAWSVTCAGLPNSGAITPPTSSRTPVWTAPVNNTAITQPCTIQVTVQDNNGLSATQSYTHNVSPAPGGHTITITSVPAGTPNPTASGAAVTLNVDAVDSEGHQLNYLWQATCAGLQSTGDFTPAENVKLPIWTAPVNPTDNDLQCIIRVFVADNFGQSTTAQFIEVINPAPHTLTLTTPPGGSPNPVASGGQASLTVAAQDSRAHTLSYLWTAACSGLPNNGTFVPNAQALTPQWIAPVNYTAAEQSCTLEFTVNDGHGLTRQASFVERVNSAPVPITLIVQSSVGGPLDNAQGTVPNYAAVVYRADGTTQVHAIDAFSLFPSTAWALDATAAEGETLLVKIWRTIDIAYSPFYDFPSVNPAWKNDPLKQELAAVSLVVHAGQTYVVTAFLDTDGDGMDDFWEQRVLAAGHPSPWLDPAVDLDGDTLKNLQESQLGTNPLSTDSDGDGVDDQVEVANGDNPANAADWLPPALRTTIGDKVIYVSWNGVLRVTSAALTVEQETAPGSGVYTSLGTLPLDPKADTYRLDTLPAPPGGPLTNLVRYRLGLQQVRNTHTRPPSASELVIARPMAMTPTDPTNPVVFLHGFGGRGDALGTFTDTLHFAVNTLGWTFGGRFCFAGANLTARIDTNLAGLTQRATTVPGLGPAGNAVCTGLGTTTNANADFFTVDFGNNFADYGADPTLGGGLFRQAREVQAVVTTLQALPGNLALVGHDTGGLAARHYLATSQNDDDVVQLVTVDSAHRGADFPYWCAAQGAPGLDTLGGGVGRILAALSASGGCTSGTTVGGVRDTQFTCPADAVNPVLSPFLSTPTMLPPDTFYSAIGGLWQASLSNAVLLPNSGRRGTDCLSQDWDGLVPKSSADLNQTGLLEFAAREVPSERFNTSAGNDVAAIFCGLNSGCVTVRVESSAVDVQGDRARRRGDVEEPRGDPRRGLHGDVGGPVPGRDGGAAVRGGRLGTRCG